MRPRPVTRANASPSASANPSPADVESDDASDDSDLVRAEEFARLDGVAYCDHAGAPPYSESLVRECMTELTSKLLGNPHSSHGAASTTAAAVAAARDATLQHLNAPVGAYVVVFTSGATAALRLVAESFPWSPSSEFRYTASNHTSVVGIRAAAMHAGARVAVVDVRAADASESAEAADPVDGDDDDKGRRRWRIVERAEILPERTPPRHPFAPSRENEDEDEDEDVAECLFAYPAECNLSGERYHPSVAAAARAADQGTRAPSPVGTPYPPRPHPRRRWRVLCDAAKCAGTRPPDLSRDGAPDFAVVSYYKMFGYPTGLGALVARRDALASLRPRYFGGGVAAGVDADEDFFRRRSGAEGLEDGTLDFAALTAVPMGFRWLANLARAADADADADATRSNSREGAAAVDARARAIARRLARRLAALRHPDGARVVRLHGAAWVERHGEATARAVSPGGVDKNTHGGTVAFSVLRPDGSPVGCVRVERAAAAEGVHVRAGCCCNPGACELAVGAPRGRPRRAHAAGKVCGDDVDVDDNGVAMGVVRASFGASSAPEDADRLADVVARHFARDFVCETARGDETSREGTARVRVTRVATFPIKGAAAFEPQGGAWPVGPCGLLYDREWALASPSGDILCPRRVPAIARLRPEIDLVRETLRVRVERAPGTGTGTGTGLDAGEPPAPLVASLRELDAGDETATVRLRGAETTVRLAGGSRAKVDAWFTAAIGAPCALVRSKPGERRSRARRPGPGAGTGTGTGTDTDTGAAIGLANSAQILLVSDASVSHLSSLVRERAARGEDRPRHDANPSPSPSLGLDAGRFRANVVVGGVGLEPYAEETAAWTAIRVGGARLAAVRPCVRCDAISALGADDDAPPGEPAASLAAFRAERRRRTGTGTGTGARVGGGGGGGGFTFGVLFDVVPKTHPGDATDAGMGSDVPGDVPGDGSGDGSGDAGTRGSGATRPAPGSREWMSRRWGAGGVLAVGDEVRVEGERSAAA
jgi:molybdenum cofactor sulfurtransferase